MEETGKEVVWISVDTAAKMLGVDVRAVHNMVSEKGLTVRGRGKGREFVLGEIEGMVREPGRARRAVNRERRLARRRMGKEGDWPADAVDVSVAMAMLGVSKAMITKLVNRGLLRSYQRVAGRTRHVFSRGELEVLRARREEEAAERSRRREQAAMEWRRPVERKWPYRHLNYSRRIEVDELSWWERYFGEWLTTRQVAWMLHISMRSVGHLCENGRLDRERFRNEMSGRVQWHFRVEKVRALMGEREYCHRRAVWERYFSVEGKAARAREAAAQFERDAAVCAEAMRKSPWHNERKVW